MPNDPSRAAWRLPPGVTRGVWEHMHAPHADGTHTQQFSPEAEHEFDEQLLERILTPPGTIVDLGCGGGRLTIPLARRGFHCVGVDLSRGALSAMNRQAEAEGLMLDSVVANLVELGCLRDCAADACISTYSTLGMIRGRESRQRALGHVRRILKPGGMFVVHVHNLWYSLRQSQSRGWLMRSLCKRIIGGDTEVGDKFFDYQGVPNFFLHAFTRRELVAELRRAGFRIEQIIPLTAERSRTVPAAWLLGRLRAGGWIAICR